MELVQLEQAGFEVLFEGGGEAAVMGGALSFAGPAASGAPGARISGFRVVGGPAAIRAFSGSLLLAQLLAQKEQGPSRFQLGPCLYWLPFVDTYRTMCRSPEPEFKRVLEDVRDMRLAA